MLTSPCIGCTKATWGCTCSRYRFWRATVVGEQLAHTDAIRQAAQEAAEFGKPDPGKTAQ